MRTVVQPAAADHAERFLRDAIAGLTAVPKRLPSKYFYDRRGSELFDRICGLREYYPTRTEMAILRRHGAAMAEALGDDLLLVEPGSGSSRKVRLLLRHLRRPAGYVPVDISADHMAGCVRALSREFPGLSIRPVHADFCEPFTVPYHEAARRRAVFFPGSTIGNFAPAAAAAFLARMARVAEPGGALLIGVDLRKDRAVLEAAYNDRQGVTRAFNLNLLHRLRRELDAEVAVDRFEHRAFYNAVEGRIEMHLVSAADQTIHLGDAAIELRSGETIHTENSYKYDLDGFNRLATAAGWRRVAVWTDPEALFSVQLFQARGPARP